MHKRSPYGGRLHEHRTNMRELQRSKGRRPQTCSLEHRVPNESERKRTIEGPQEGSMAILYRHVPMTDMHGTMNHISNFQILQNNLNHNSASTDSILSHPDSSQYALLLLQEQHCLRNTLSSPIHSSWTLIEPTVEPPLHP